VGKTSSPYMASSPLISSTYDDFKLKYNSLPSLYVFSIEKQRFWENFCESYKKLKFSKLEKAIMLMKTIMVWFIFIKKFNQKLRLELICFEYPVLRMKDLKNKTFKKRKAISTFVAKVYTQIMFKFGLITNK
jgi:hypothetical protein